MLECFFRNGGGDKRGLDDGKSITYLKYGLLRLPKYIHQVVSVWYVKPSCLMRQLSLKMLLPFLTSYVCKVGFSTLSATRNKLSNRLDIRNTLRVSLSPSTPHWECLVAGKQSLSSHWFRSTSTSTMLQCLYSVCSCKKMWNWKVGQWLYMLTWRKMQALFMSACVYVCTRILSILNWSLVQKSLETHSYSSTDSRW